MSDDEMEYEFEYEDEDENMEEDVDIENEYYSAKSIVDSDPQAALAGFARVLDMETEKGKWGFKALKRSIKVLAKLNRSSEVIDQFRALLSYTKSAVTRNDSEKAINSLLDYVSTSSCALHVLQELCTLTLSALEGNQNERLWFSALLRSGRLAFEASDFVRVSRILKDLYGFCNSDAGNTDSKRGTQLLEVYALDIMLCTAQRNNKRLKELYEKSLRVRAAIPHPRIMGVIRECGGKMHMMDKRWSEATSAFFEAFKSYDEAGHPRRTQCLKYLVLSSMLNRSNIDPFDSQEAKPYKNDPEVLAMTSLLEAYQSDDVYSFERVLNDNRRGIMDDDFLKDYVEELLTSIRTQVLIKLIKPFKTVQISFIAKELNISVDEVESLLTFLILDGQVDGLVDQANDYLILNNAVELCLRPSAVGKWIKQLEIVHDGLSRKVL
eukprot:ANDGO_04907.mRNA.1 COP9 signalosome complex subunit 2